MNERLEDNNPGISRGWKSFAKRQEGELPYSAESEKKSPKQGIVQYEDGSRVLIFWGEGTELDWSDNKWVDYPSLSTVNPMIVTTESGNHYGFMGGDVLNEKERQGAKVGEGAPPIRFGEPWEIPIVTESGERRVQRTTPIVNVVVKYNMTSPGSGGLQAAGLSPFNKLQEAFEQYNQQHNKQ